MEQWSFGINDGRPMSITSHVPLTRATCVSHDMSNTTSLCMQSMALHLMWSAASACASQLCDLDDDLNVSSTEEQTA